MKCCDVISTTSVSTLVNNLPGGMVALSLHEDEF
jgi:hypothetical protein